MLVDDGDISEAEMGKHPEQGILTRSISGKKVPQARLSKPTPYYAKQGLLVCSDGYWENLAVDQVSYFINKPQNLQKDLQKQVNIAKQAGAENCDNISVFVFLNGK